jgi:hypothetical protein
MHYNRLLFFLSKIILFTAGTAAAQDCDLTLTGVQPVGGARLRQLSAPPEMATTPAGFGPGIFGGPPAKVAESYFPKAPARVTPPASASMNS